MFKSFLRDETGAVTIDWVALTSGILVMGIVLVYAIFNHGVSSLAGTINSGLVSAGTLATAPTGPITTATFE